MSCKSCWSYDNDHNRAISKELCPYCWYTREKISTEKFIKSVFYCNGYSYMDWSKEREWDNETEWWADGVKPISTPQITIENRHYKDITSRRQVD